MLVRHPHCLSARLVCFGTLLLATTAIGQISVSTVMFTGQHAPIPDAYFGGVYFPTLSNDGTVTFEARTYGERDLWSGSPGNLHAILLGGRRAPGTPDGVWFASCYAQASTAKSSSAVAALASLGGPGVDSTNDRGIWLTSGGALTLVARGGDHAPGTEDGVVFDSASLRSFRLNTSGDVAFNASVKGPGVSNAGVWRSDEGTLSLLARTGSAAPDTPTGTTFTGFFQPELDNVGRVAFRATVGGVGVDTSNSSGIWSEANGTLRLLARTGEQAPGAPAQTTFSSFGEMHAQDSGAVVFRATVATPGVDSTKTGIWSANSGAVEPLFQSGSQAPGMKEGVTMDLTSFDVNERQELALFASINDPETGRVPSIWSGLPGSLRLIAEQGMNAPGTTTSFTMFPSTLTSPYVTATNSINSSGQIVFRAMLDSPFDMGIWATDKNGLLQLIVRSGDLLEVAPNDFRTVRLLSGEQINDLGQIAFMAEFTDRSSGLFVATIPEPVSVVVFLAGISLTARRRLRRRA
jgi:hypothetical protein